MISNPDSQVSPQSAPFHTHIYASRLSVTSNMPCALSQHTSLAPVSDSVTFYISLHCSHFTIAVRPHIGSNLKSFGYGYLDGSLNLFIIHLMATDCGTFDLRSD